MDIKNAVLAGAMGLIVSVGAVWYIQPAQGPAGIDGKDGNVGAISSPVLPYNYLCVGGVCDYTYKQVLQTSTTTASAIQAPASATSTLQSYVCGVDFATTTVAKVAYLATGAGPQSSTTVLYQGNIALGGGATLVASTSIPSILPKVIIAPGHWVNLSMQGGVGVDTAPVGVCQATFRVIDRSF